MRSGGFTLVEVVLSIAILGVGLVGMLYAFQGSVTASVLADQTLIATNIARETMEKIIAQRDCDEVGCGYSATLSSINTQNSYDENPVTGLSSYVLNSTALEVNSDDDDALDDFLDPSPGSGYARVTVQVSWNSGNQSISLATLIANY